MSFSTQPNEMLDMILNQTGIPLAQRIRLRAVSPRFLATLEDGLQRENSLVIRVVGLRELKNINNGYCTVQPNDLILNVSNFTKKKAIDFIKRLFPHVTELAIDSNSLIAWRKATELLRHFALTLLSLKVDGNLKNISARESVFRSLGQVINSIATLSSLYLENENLFDCNYQSNIGHHLLFHLAPTLSRLERFTLDKPVLHQANFIATTLSSRCTHLRLELTHNSDTTLPLHDATNLVHLHLGYINDAVLSIVAQLPKLTTLTLNDMKMPDLDTLLQKIRPQSQVAHVTFIGIRYRRPLESPASKAFTFPYIKRLTLQLSYFNPYIPFNAMNYLQTLAIWFPSLSTCALYCPESYREGILAIQEGGLPFAVKLLDNFTPTFE